MSAVLDERPPTLRAGWYWTTKGEIAHVVGGGTPRTNDSMNFGGGDVPWITPADLSGYAEKYISHGARFITRKGLESSSAKLLPAGTVLFTSRAPIGYAAIARNPVATNQGFESFVLKDGVLPEYVYWWLNGSKQRAEALAICTTLLELSGANAKKIPIPIAPIHDSRISRTNETITKDGLANSSTQINPAGSVLLGMIGQGRTRGQAAILDLAAANNQNCAAIWVSQTPVRPEFVYYWLMSRYERTRGEGSGNHQQALNKKLVEAIPLPLPPLREQHRIVAEVDRRHRPRGRGRSRCEPQARASAAAGVAGARVREPDRIEWRSRAPTERGHGRALSQQGEARDAV